MNYKKCKRCQRVDHCPFYMSKSIKGKGCALFKGNKSNAEIALRAMLGNKIVDKFLKLNNQ